MTLETDLELELQSLLTFLYMVPVGVVQMGADGGIVLINPMAANLLNALQADGAMTNLFDVLDQCFPEIRKLVSEFAQPNGVICKAARFSPFLRARRYTECKTYDLTMVKVNVTTLIGVVNDVSDVVLREEQIRLGSAWYNALLYDRFNYGVTGLDREGRVLNWSNSMMALTGHPAELVINSHCSALFKDAKCFADRLPDLLHEVSESGWTLQNDWCVRKDGSSFWASYIISIPEIHVSAVEGDGQLSPRHASYVLLVRDINNHVDATEKMIHATVCDDLTGLLNRRAFFDKAEVEISRWRRSQNPFCILIIDADYFKSVNDRFGHDVGDSALKALAKAIKQCVRQLDIVARIGGEEFAVLLPFTEIGDARELADRVRQCVSELTVGLNHEGLALTISVGAAEMTARHGDIRGLLKAADGALYRAKNLGRNQVQCA